MLAGATSFARSSRNGAHCAAAAATVVLATDDIAPDSALKISISSLVMASRPVCPFFCCCGVCAYVAVDDFRYYQGRQSPSLVVRPLSGHIFRQIQARRVFEEFISRSSKTQVPRRCRCHPRQYTITTTTTINVSLVLCDQVNIPSAMYREVLESFDKCPVTLFHRSEQEVIASTASVHSPQVFNLMLKDALPGFLQSEEHTAYVHDVPTS